MPSTIFPDSSKYQFINTKEYQEHKVFELLDDLISFYTSLSFHIIQYVSPGVALKVAVNYETYIFSSLAGTLESVKTILKTGLINDAFALIRKYDDGILTNIYINCFVQENMSIDNLIVEKVNNWIQGRERFPSSEKQIEYIRKYEGLKEYNKLFDYEGIYHKIRRRCNDNVHFNSLYYMLLNDSEVHLGSRIKELDNLNYIIKHFFVFHFICFFSQNQAYMLASDYIDYLDCGENPPEDSIHWVAPFVQTIFDKYIQTTRKDLAVLFIERCELYLN